VRGAALVTGAGLRLGRAIAEALAADGYALAVHYNTSREAADTLVASIRASGGTAHAIGGDLGEPDAATALIAEATGALGPVRLLVNSASVYEPDGIGTLSQKTLTRSAAVNFVAPVLLMQAFAAQGPAVLGPEGGAIVNMLDVQLDAPSPDYFGYFCAKAALAEATRLAALALAPAIRVNAIAPGLVLPSAGQTPETFRSRQGLTPLGTGLGATDIAEAVRYLASARHVTGHILPVDSGQRLMGFGNADLAPPRS